MKLLCLVLASDTTPLYQSLLDQWRRFAHLNPAITTIFFMADPNATEVVQCYDDVCIVKGPETLEFVPKKFFTTLHAFRDTFSSYDFIFRTNLSSFVYFPRLLALCERITSRSRFCSAIQGIYKVPFPSGSGFLISPDVASLLVDEYHMVEHLPYLDDVIVGHILHKHNISIQDAIRFEIPESFSLDTCVDLAKEGIQYHIRIKTSDRERDIETLKMCIDTFYNLKS